MRHIILLFLVIGLFSACIQESSSQATTETPTKASPIEEPSTTHVVTNDTDSDKKRIVFFGNSLTAGYGLDEESSFPSLIQNRLDSLGLDYTAINAGLSGETSSGGLNRIDWVLKQPVDIFVLELGANDALRGLKLSATRKNLSAISPFVGSTAAACSRGIFNPPISKVVTPNLAHRRVE